MESILSAWMRYVSHAPECRNRQCQQSRRFPFRCKRRGVWRRGSWFCSDICLQSEIERVVERFSSRSILRLLLRIECRLDS
jgi:hypothetical protein